MAASIQQVNANRENARKSTGPKTPEGKKRSSKNAIKHGLTSVAPILPNEDNTVYQTRLTEYLDYFEPRDPTQRDLCEQAVTAKWKLDRCNRVENARLGEKVRHAVTEHDLKNRIAAVELGRRLLDDPVAHCKNAETMIPHVRDAIADRAANDPAILVRQLESTADGVQVMLDEWTTIAEMLEFYNFWHYVEKFKAIRLLGKRPADVCEDPNIAEIFLACNSIHPAAWALWDDCHQARIGVENRPNFIGHVDFMENVRLDHDGSRKRLDHIVKEQMTRLKKLKATLDPVAEADRVGAESKAMFDDSKEGQLLLRYQVAHERELHRSIHALRMSKKDEKRAQSEPDYTAVPDEETEPERNEAIAEPEPREEIEETAPEPAAPEPAVDPGKTHAPVFNYLELIGRSPKTPPDRPL